MPLIPKAHNKDWTAQAELHGSICQSNIDSIFTYNYDSTDSSLFGAKAVAYKNVAGRIEVFFFPQGKARVGNNVHHRDVFATILEFELESEEFKSYHKVLEVIAQLYSMEPPEVYEAAERVFAPAPQASELARRFVDEVVMKGAWNDAFVPLLELPEGIAQLSTLVKQRSNHDLEADSLFNWLFTAQGYQFSARRSTKGLIVESAQMDSSLTSLQKKYPERARPDLYKAMNAEVLSRINSRLRRFQRIEIPNDLETS